MQLSDSVLPPDRKSAAAEALAQAYSEIGNVGDCAVAVSSKELFIQVVFSLVALFGRGDRNVAIHIKSDELLLPPDRSRLLVLIASELVIIIRICRAVVILDSPLR